MRGVQMNTAPCLLTMASLAGQIWSYHAIPTLETPRAPVNIPRRSIPSPLTLTTNLLALRKRTSCRLLELSSHSAAGSLHHGPKRYKADLPWRSRLVRHRSRVRKDRCLREYAYLVQRHDGTTALLVHRSDEALGVRVSVARIAPSLLELGRGAPYSPIKQRFFFSVVGRTPAGTSRPRSRSEGAIRATLTRTPSVSSLLRTGVQCFRRDAVLCKLDPPTAALRGAVGVEELSAPCCNHLDISAVSYWLSMNETFRIFSVFKISVAASQGGWLFLDGPSALEIPEKHPSTNGIVRYDSHMRKSGVTRPGIEPGSPWWAAEEYTTCREVDLRQDFEKCSFYREQPITDGRKHRRMTDGRTDGQPTGAADGCVNLQLPALHPSNLSSRVGWTPMGPERPRSRSEGAIRATLTRTPSASSLLRARRAVFTVGQDLPSEVDGEVVLGCVDVSLNQLLSKLITSNGTCVNGRPFARLSGQELDSLNTPSTRIHNVHTRRSLADLSEVLILPRISYIWFAREDDGAALKRRGAMAASSPLSSPLKEMFKMPSISTDTCINPLLHGHPDVLRNLWKNPDCFANRLNTVTECAHIVHWDCREIRRDEGMGWNEEIWVALNIEVMRRRKVTEGGGEPETPEKTRRPGIVRHDSQERKSGSDLAGNRTRFASIRIRVVWTLHHRGPICRDVRSNGYGVRIIHRHLQPRNLGTNVLVVCRSYAGSFAISQALQLYASWIYSALLADIDKNSTGSYRPWLLSHRGVDDESRTHRHTRNQLDGRADVQKA
ncbi:hypothetical protein PR048_007175 [Dryococelus australis]|uniref:Uncharacterized protein n=1 Tax=Dryococelus australis TaxID=614101 RepID=A0ABQ9IF30_9NEOP|nr:hypothetical protein PR048_007175 [Dryococelus australis]